MAKIPFAEWLPDNPDLSGAATEALNVYPRTATSYGSLGTVVEYSNALSGRCLGAASIRVTDSGVIHNFAGTADKLYKISGDTYGDVSKSGGYSLSDGERWQFAQYGDRVIAAAMGEPLQVWDLATSPTAFADLAATAPQARHISVIRDFVMVGNTWDSTNGYRPSRVWWSGIDAPASWPTPATQAAYNAQSDFQELPSGGWVQAIVGAIGGLDGAIFCESSLFTVNYAGSPNIFTFNEIERGRGTPAPDSVVNTGRMAAYLSEDGFYVFNGASSTAIGTGKIDKWFWSKVDQNYLSFVVGVADPINKLVMWAFPDGNAGSTCNNLIIWNWELNRWSHGEINCEAIFSLRTLGYTLESLSAKYSDLDALPFSLDSRIWTGGRPALGVFNTSHKLGFLTGASLAATITTGEFDGDGRRVFISGVRPIIDGGNPTVSIGSRDSLRDSLNYSFATQPEADGICPQRVSTRYARARITTQAGDKWTHAMGVEPVYTVEGRR